MKEGAERIDPGKVMRWARMVLLGATMVFAYLLVSRYHIWSMN